MTSVSEAVRLIEARMPLWPAQRIPIDAAPGRILAQSVVAERDIPAFDRVTMDGIAIAGAAWKSGVREFAIAGTQAAGVPPMSISADTQCVRVMTGAVLPAGTDTVIPVERLTLSEATASIEAHAPVEHGQFVHRLGSDRRAGAPLLAPGTLLGAAELAVLASVGQANVEVARLPRIAVISTGDELVGVDEPVAAHQIRSSNGRAIEAAIRIHNCGIVTRRRLLDEPDNLLSELESLHASHDVLILSGGVSMGDFDFVPGALKHLGAELVFHRIEQKPGRPMWFGVSGENKPIFALPGNPVSTLVCVARYVVPALRRALGLVQSPEYAVLSEAPKDGPTRFTWFVPVTLSTSTRGQLEATPHQINTSGDFSSLASTDGIVELAPDEHSRTKGAVARVFRW